MIKYIEGIIIAVIAGVILMWFGSNKSTEPLKTKIDRSIASKQTYDIAETSEKLKEEDEKEKKKKRAKKYIDKTLGMTVIELTPDIKEKFGINENYGILVVETEYGSLAANAGIIAGDVIIDINNRKIQSCDDYYHTIISLKTSVTGFRKVFARLLVKRKGKELSAPIEMWSREPF